MTTDKATTQKKGKVLNGTVESIPSIDTIKVSVMRYVKHPKYKKFVKQVKKYLVHDKGNTKKEGEKVTIKETRPISKRKHFIVIDEK